jgi:hypothetical protein
VLRFRDSGDAASSNAVVANKLDLSPDAWRAPNAWSTLE